MEQFTFSTAARVEYGEGKAESVGGVLPSLLENSAARPLLVTDPGIIDAGLLSPVTSSLRDSGIAFVLFDEVEPNPRDQTVRAGSKIYRSEETNSIVAVGGGSVMDAAKAIGVLAKYGGAVSDYDGLDTVPGSIPPLVAIPTTAGTGSEVTMWAVVTDTDHHVKLGIGDRKIIPAIALVDPAMTYTLPTHMTIGSGLDALTHAVESYTCNLANPVSDVLALEAIRLVAENLPTAAERGEDREARDGMMLGSLLAGMSFGNADCAGVHALSESIGGMYDAPHGMVNGILLPHLMAYNVEAVPDRYADVAEALGAPRNPEASVNEVRRLLEQLEVPSLREFGVSSEDFGELAQMSMSHPCSLSNPRPLDEEDWMQLLERALSGQW